MCMSVFKFLSEITEPTEDKVHVGPPRERGKIIQMIRVSCRSLFRYCQPPGAGLLEGILPQTWPGSAGLLAGL